MDKGDLANQKDNTNDESSVSGVIFLVRVTLTLPWVGQPACHTILLAKAELYNPRIQFPKKAANVLQYAQHLRLYAFLFKRTSTSLWSMTSLLSLSRVSDPTARMSRAWATTNTLTKITTTTRVIVIDNRACEQTAMSPSGKKIYTFVETCHEIIRYLAHTCYST